MAHLQSAAVLLYSGYFHKNSSAPHHDMFTLINSGLIKSNRIYLLSYGGSLWSSLFKIHMMRGVFFRICPSLSFHAPLIFSSIVHAYFV